MQNKNIASELELQEGFGWVKETEAGGAKPQHEVAQGEWTGRSLGGDGEETLASGERYTARRSECGRGSLGDVERASE